MTTSDECGDNLDKLMKRDLKGEKKAKKEKKEKKAKKDKKRDRNGKNNKETSNSSKHDDGGSKKRKRDKSSEKGIEEKKIRNIYDTSDDRNSGSNTSKILSSKNISFPIKYILAPMVGASELPFRLLCRKYGAQTAYTPMMNSHLFATDKKYREEEFQTIEQDRPLVCHFSANDPKDFAAAAKLVENKCDAVDLNLGCPQRTAYLEHFGSYLLDIKDRDLICSIVSEASRTVSIPIFVKIRLLDTIEDTIELCQQLKDAGASLIAIHARYRASFERKGPGARDGESTLT